MASQLGTWAFQRLYIHFMIFSYHVWCSGWIYLVLSVTCAWKNRDSVASQVWGSCHEGGCEASRRTAPGEASGWKWSLLKDGKQKESQWFHFMISCWRSQKLWSRPPGTSFLSEPLKLEGQPHFWHFFTSDMFFASCVNFQTGNVWMWKLDGLPPNGIVDRQRSGHLVSPLVSHWENLQLGYFGNTNESRIFSKLYMTL